MAVRSVNIGPRAGEAPSAQLPLTRVARILRIANLRAPTPTDKAVAHDPKGPLGETGRGRGGGAASGTIRSNPWGGPGRTCARATRSAIVGASSGSSW